jgi:hypothetical protein
VAEVGDGGGPKRTLGTLEVQAVRTIPNEHLEHLEGVEDDPDVVQVLRLGRPVYQYVIEKDQHKPAEVWPKNVVHQCLKVAVALAGPKGITKNS